ncbi:MAG: FMN-binding protein [Lentisphaerae bacterium]|nr:FMN-binding protein [Lentisphaerota bacterium]
MKEIAGAVGFMGLLSLVSISGVAALHLATAERVARNADLFLQRAVLEAAGVAVPDAPAAAAELFRREVAVEDGSIASGRFVVRAPDAAARRTVVYRRRGRGLWGVIDAVVAVDPDAGVFGQLRILGHNETPGLGARIEEAWFQRQIAGKTGPFALKPEGTRSEAPTEIDAITGATLSSAAVRDILNAVVRDTAEAKEAGSP